MNTKTDPVLKLLYCVIAGILLLGLVMILGIM